MSSTSPLSVFTESDLAQLRARGLDEDDALDQLQRIRQGSGQIELLRPATVGDGIERLTGLEASLEAAGRVGVATGRCSFFIPASGAATRMFQYLIPNLHEGVETGATRRLLAELPHFAFHDALASTLERRGRSLERLRAEGEARPILEALLSPDGLDYARCPKALVLFHRAAEGPRTALEEHLVDGAAVMADENRLCHLHFTVAPEREAEFATYARDRATKIGAHAGVTFDLGFSSQSPATDCLAVTPEGAPFRDRDGRLVFRPGGHGALLRNLAASGSDYAFLKNVDNVSTSKAATYRWIPILLGRLAELERGAKVLMRRLDDEADLGAVEDALRFAAHTFHRAGDPPRDVGARGHARALLDRPLRVCGMVPNAGEPGGGPFWARDPDGSETLQIVEGAQIAPEHRHLLEESTHFNPVFMACALRDHRHRPRDLARFVDPNAGIVTYKSVDGRELLAFERPGLWNGAMARWNTVFVEVPAATFAPVKTVFDLLRPEHQPPI